MDSLSKEVETLKVEIAVLKSTLEQWMEGAIEHRKVLSLKLDDIQKFLLGLQCPIHAEQIKSINGRLDIHKQLIAYLWTFLTVTFFGTLFVLFKH